MAVVTPNDRPKSVRNLCVTKVLVAFFYVVTLLFGFYSVGVGNSFIGLSQISSFFSLYHLGCHVWASFQQFQCNLVHIVTGGRNRRTKAPMAYKG